MAATAFVMAGIGLWISERMSSDQARFLTALPPALTAAMVIGGTACSVLIYLTGYPTRMSDRSSAFWGIGDGSGFGSRFIGEASVSAVAALAWSGAMLALFR
jgi:hypothetical protein